MATKTESRTAKSRGHEVPAAQGLQAPAGEPGKGAAWEKYSFAGLGKLGEFPKEIMDMNEGHGEKVVVIVDFLSANEQKLRKGDIVRLSRVIQGYADPDVSDDEKRAEIRRLFDAGAIRLATREEETMSHIDLNMLTETAEVRAERDKRIASEQKLKEYEARFGPLDEEAVEGQESSDDDDDMN